MGFRSCFRSHLAAESANRERERQDANKLKDERNKEPPGKPARYSD